MLKYYHNLKLFTRDDALCRKTETSLSTVTRLAVMLLMNMKDEAADRFILTKLSTTDMLIDGGMAQLQSSQRRDDLWRHQRPKTHPW